jgi:hypothetical protein
MAFLYVRLDRRSAASAALLGLIVATIGALAGCVLFGGEHTVKREWAFSHSVHLAQELACTDCHAAAESGDEPGMPRLAACRLCHAKLDEGKPPERKVDAFFVDGKFHSVDKGMLSNEIVFSHARHVAAGETCDTCHAGIATNDDALLLPSASMDACTRCHSQLGVVDVCATCHTTVRAEIAPPSHEKNWQFRHGSVCRRGSDAMADRCTLCHQETSCAACHMTNLPRDHTDQWRRVGHGISASLDRDRCAICHQPDSCVRCHSTVQPASHTGSFGSPRDNHCLGCHQPLSAEGCVACHPGTPSHALAHPKPPDHNPAMNCRQCHIPGGVQPPMPHVDNGDNCNSCHH